MTSFLFAMQQVAPPADSILKVIGISVAIMTGVVGLLLLLYDRLRGSGKLDADMHNSVRELTQKVAVLERDFGMIELQLSQLDKKLSEVLYELKGTDGLNGIKGLSRAHAAEIAAIKKRLHSMDVVAALLKAQQEASYSGVEKRHSMRRDIDVKLMDLVRPDDDDDGN